MIIPDLDKLLEVEELMSEVVEDMMELILAYQVGQSIYES